MVPKMDKINVQSMLKSPQLNMIGRMCIFEDNALTLKEKKIQMLIFWKIPYIRKDSIAAVIGTLLH